MLNSARRIGLLPTICHVHFKNLLKIHRRQFAVEVNALKAAFLEKYKDPLVYGPNPHKNQKCGDEQVRIGVSFCALNQYDLQYIAGRAKPKIPFIPGSELSGVVLEVGKKCTRGFNVGDKVLALPVKKYRGGGLATECIVRETECHPIGSVSLEEATALGLSYGAAHYAFSCLRPIKENEEIIIFAGIGGDGLAAIEIAGKVYKSKVHAVCDTDSTKALLRDDCVYKAYNGKGAATKVYKTFDATFTDKSVKTVYDGVSCGMIHVACDFVNTSGQYLTTDPLFIPEYFVSAKPDFKKVTSKHRKQNPIDVNPKYDHLIAQTKQIDFASLQLQDPGLFTKLLNEVFELHAKGIIEPYISHIFTLRDINKAVKYAQGRKCLGKVLIDVGSKNAS